MVTVKVITPKHIGSFLQRLPTEMRQFFQRGVFKLRGGSRYRQQLVQESLRQALAAHQPRADISDHLSSLFFFALLSRPCLIVELGTRGGESTRALLSAAAFSDAIVLSVDIRDCSSLELSGTARWRFVQADDVEFGQIGFEQWCKTNGLEPKIDFLFVDTSHEYEHTKQEIKVWSQYLSGNGLMVFHDTNMGKGVYGRLDGTVHSGWNNQRGVIRAIEDFLECSYDERKFFCDYRRGFLVKHDPNCNGLTALVRLRPS
jgi:predicted O-methyltransferase YrrM